jgi:hypothetical protein
MKKMENKKKQGKHEKRKERKGQDKGQLKLWKKATIKGRKYKEKSSG